MVAGTQGQAQTQCLISKNIAGHTLQTQIG